MSEADLKSIRMLLETVSWLSEHDLAEHDLAQPLGPGPSNGCAAEVEAVLAHVQKRRAEELSLRGIALSDAQNGKLLLLLVEINLMDGAAHGVSNGFFDQFNLPPIATWVDMRVVGPDNETALLCWVPETHVPDAQAGIDVNPEECMGWARELAPNLYRELADGV